MAKKAAQQSEPESVDVLPDDAVVDVSSGRRPRRPWWPAAALSVLLIALAASIISMGQVTLVTPDAKGAFLVATPRLEGLDSITAPVPTATPDPKSFAQKIEIILPPPPPPPPPATSGGSKGSGITLNKVDAGKFCANINSQREAYGLPKLSSCYATSARQKHANAMAASSTPQIWHAGDNIVGVAPSHSQLIQAFMNSQGHKDQILTESYTGAKVGCAWGQPSGYVPLIYCTADFY